MSILTDKPMNVGLTAAAANDPVHNRARHFTIQQIMKTEAQISKGSMMRKDMFSGAHAYVMLGELAGEELERLRKLLDKDLALMRMIARSYHMGLKLGVMRKISEDSIKQIDALLDKIEPDKKFNKKRVDDLKEDRRTFINYKRIIELLDYKRLHAEPENFEHVEAEFEEFHDEFEDHLNSYKTRSTKSAFNTETHTLEDVDKLTRLRGEEGQTLVQKILALFSFSGNSDGDQGDQDEDYDPDFSPRAS